MVMMLGRGDWAWIGILAGVTAYELHPDIRGIQESRERGDHVAAARSGHAREHHVSLGSKIQF